MSPSSDRSYIWVFYTSAGFLFASAVLRSLLVIESATVLLEALLLLLFWLGLFASERAMSRRWSHWPTVYMVVQTAIVFGLFLLPGDDDFFAALFAVLSMQALQRFGFRGAAWLVVFALLMLVPFLADYPPAQAVSLTLVYSAVNVFMGAYALATRRAEEARNRNRALGRDLETANAELRDYSKRLEGLAVTRERNRLARELHDSVTQTIFSMTLASQSAAILLPSEPSKADAQLERLRQLAESALAEMRVLISELKPDALANGDLAEAIRRDIERRNRDGMDVSFEVEDMAPNPAVEPLSAAEQVALFRIAQEALNNVVKHAGTSEAVIRLSLGERPRLEIRDRGSGFDVQDTQGGAGMGLTGMGERAAEIGWVLDVDSTPGRGTRVVVQRAADQGGGR
jgi:signal transduction histidine kinase